MAAIIFVARLPVAGNGGVFLSFLSGTDACAVTAAAALLYENEGYLSYRKSGRVEKKKKRSAIAGFQENLPNAVL